MYFLRLDRLAWSSWGILAVVHVILLVEISVHNNIWRNSRDKAIDESSDLSSSDDLGVDEIAMQLEDEIDNLRRVHPLFNVAGQGDLIDTNLIHR